MCWLLERVCLWCNLWFWFFFPLFFFVQIWTCGEAYSMQHDENFFFFLFHESFAVSIWRSCNFFLLSFPTESPRQLTQRSGGSAKGEHHDSRWSYLSLYLILSCVAKERVCVCVHVNVCACMWRADTKAEVSGSRNAKRDVLMAPTHNTYSTS